MDRKKHKTSIKEFSLQTASFFVSPLRREKASEFLGRLIESLGQHVDAKNTRFSWKDPVFDYQLTVSLLTGAAQVVLEPHSLVSILPKGFNRQNLTFVADCFIKVFEAAAPNPVAGTNVTFSAHCAFSNPSDYSEYMDPFVSKEMGIESGGRLLSAAGRSFDGKVRISIEKSAMLDDALFVAVTFFTKESLRLDLLEKMNSRSFELLDTLGIQMELADPKPQS
jgi:hypothetical protein